MTETVITEFVSRGELIEVVIDASNFKASKEAIAKLKGEKRLKGKTVVGSFINGGAFVAAAPPLLRAFEAAMEGAKASAWALPNFAQKEWRFKVNGKGTRPAPIPFSAWNRSTQDELTSASVATEAPVAVAPDSVRTTRYHREKDSPIPNTVMFTVDVSRKSSPNSVGELREQGAAVRGVDGEVVYVAWAAGGYPEAKDREAIGEGLLQAGATAVVRKKKDTVLVIASADAIPAESPWTPA